MNITSISLRTETADKPYVHFADPTLDTHQHISVYIGQQYGNVHIAAWEPEALFALADAFLAAGQQLSQALDNKAAREVNAATAAADSCAKGNHGICDGDHASKAVA